MVSSEVAFLLGGAVVCGTPAAARCNLDILLALCRAGNQALAATAAVRMLRVSKGLLMVHAIMLLVSSPVSSFCIFWSLVARGAEDPVSHALLRHTSQSFSSLPRTPIDYFNFVRWEKRIEGAAQTHKQQQRVGQTTVYLLLFAMGNLISRRHGDEDYSDSSLDSSDDDDDDDVTAVQTKDAPAPVLAPARKSPALTTTDTASSSSKEKRKATKLTSTDTNDGNAAGRAKKRAKGGSVWEEQYEKLQDFKKKYGHTKVRPSCNNKEMKSLYDWLYFNKKRKHGPYKGCSQLTADRIDKLNKIGIEWEVCSNERLSWDALFAELDAFCKKKGHCKVPQKTHRRLYAWLNNQQRRLKGQRQPPLTASQIEKLKSVGVSWA